MTDRDPLASLSRDALAVICYVANQPVGSVGLPFETLWDFRQDWWRGVGERLRELASEPAMTADEEAR